MAAQITLLLKVKITIYCTYRPTFLVRLPEECRSLEQFLLYLQTIPFILMQITVDKYSVSIYLFFYFVLFYFVLFYLFIYLFIYYIIYVYMYVLIYSFVRNFILSFLFNHTCASHYDIPSLFIIYHMTHLLCVAKMFNRTSSRVAWACIGILQTKQSERYVEASKSSHLFQCSC